MSIGRYTKLLLALVMQTSCGSGIEFGDDSGATAHNGICDDRRFTGALVGYAVEERTDATDCRKLLQAGAIAFDTLTQPRSVLDEGSAQISAAPMASGGMDPSSERGDLDEFRDENGQYVFQAPRGLFRRSGPNEYVSDALQARISVNSDFTQWFDETGIFRKEDLVNRYKAQLRLTYEAGKSDWFVLSGYGSGGALIYIKGLYSELSSMQGRDEGEPKWLWSKSVVLKLSYPEANKAPFDTVIPMIARSFTLLP